MQEDAPDGSVEIQGARKESPQIEQRKFINMLETHTHALVVNNVDFNFF